MPSLAANLDQTLRDLLALLGPLLHTSCLRRSAASLRMRRSGRAPAAVQRTCRALPRRLANRDGATGQECAIGMHSSVCVCVETVMLLS